jgi:hypothetical protein
MLDCSDFGPVLPAPLQPPRDTWGGGGHGGQAGVA